MVNLLPCPGSDCAVMACPNLSAADLHRYRPIPVDFLSCLPLYPVYPFSKIRGRSSGAMPIPVSDTVSRFFLSTSMVTVP